jgi:hypothetical protein
LSRSAPFACCALLLATAVASAVAPESAEAKNSCRTASTARGNQIVTATNQAVVFFSKEMKQDVACSYKDKRQVKLEKFACCSVLRYRLGGRYLAYAYRLDEADNEVDELGVVDLRTGKRLEFDGMRLVYTYGVAPSFYVTPRGTLAWLNFDYDENGDVTRTVRVGEPGGKTKELDKGNIARGSLALSSNGRTLYWTKDGTLQSSPVD